MPLGQLRVYEELSKKYRRTRAFLTDLQPCTRSGPVCCLEEGEWRKYFVWCNAVRDRVLHKFVGEV